MVGLPSEGDVLAGKYRVERVVGRGGMGVVLAAWHLELDQRVALKFLQPELAERDEAAERFRREARAVARIRSEHVARVIDVGTLEGGIPYMVMEYLDGQDLSEEFRLRGALPIRECVDYVIQAIEAVAEAHALGIVHRDLKPENLFLARRADGTRSVKVLDFGISKTLVLGSPEARSLTETSTMMGSPLYMSPEQMRAPRDVDARTDIWSIGAILYDLLAGRPPYVADTIPQLCTAVLESDPPPLRELRADIDPHLEKIIGRCLAKDRTHRWRTVAELARALLPFGTASSRIHVERASRVLHSTAESVSSGSATLHSAAGAPETPRQGQETAGSWGASGPISELKSAPSRRRAPLVVGGALVVLAVGANLRILAGSPRTNPPPPPLAALAPRTEPLAASSAEAPQLVATAVAAASAAPVPDAPASVETQAVKPVGRLPNPSDSHGKRAAAPRPAAPAKTGSGGGLTDFGGRR
jgi:serine/threonine protein kinase